MTPEVRYHMLRPAQIVKRREAYERDPAGFAADWHGKDMALRRKVQKARGTR